MADANERSLRRELQQGRRAGEGDGSTVDGLSYQGPAGMPRSVQGDLEAPWVKAPPFPASVQPWFTAETGGTPDLPIDDYVFTTPIDVEQRRVLNVWLDYTAQGGEGDAGLSIVPQVFNDAAGAEGEFWNTVVIDPTLTVVDLSATVLALPGVGSRLYRPAEFRSPVFIDGTRWRVTIPFDVTPYGRFRLAVGALGGGGSVVLNYSFAN
jgi:hypothetical protein